MVSTIPHKIGIVGLLPDQAKKVEADFPGLGLKFIPRDREKEVPVLVKTLDSVVVMTKFISHSTWGAIPRDKMYNCNGGLTELRTQLRALAAAHTPAAPPPISGSIPKHPSLKGTAAMSTSVVMDYKALRTLPVGEILSIKRPPHTTLADFEKKVKSSLYYYEKTHGIHTTHGFKDGHVEIMVDKIDGQKVPRKKVSEPLLPPATSDKAHKEAFLKKYPQDSVEAQFWRDIFARLTSALPGASQDSLAISCDKALAHYLERFE